ncbi:response regulator transcription factor [Brevibacillus sp. HB1.2]|uniref:DNA-binding response regulator n=1 Tax=Brevibacillus porteri TaxID=2126350 RepID=A0ABX5FQ59_9BACL|nr:response regulator transcription factor [Brevibacillus porteri]ATF13392.1 DNA-binding response regulator [Brevibacillus brevis X23]NRS15465.1 response regulator transcription factor [Brevibacillus sp. HB1.4B]NTU18877.1 response regulator transcription factor [Brevibacillus sp. HB1.2]NTU29686.1 response regulator transcription factor [Brevibacillus sp. HB1.1]MED1801230.1 response regulator transcription factor [Brevibacillus porteri]
MIRVLLVDDHTMIRKGLRVLLESYSQIKIVGESHTGNDAILKANQLEPDVVLMDLSLPNGLDGFSASNEIRKSNPFVKIVILTMHDEEIFVQKAITVGAHGYILKNSHGELLFQAIVEVYKGKRFYKTSVSQEIIHLWLKSDAKTMPSVLTLREKELVRLIVLGYTNKEMADKLLISVKTVENHKTNIMQKLGLDSKHQLIQYAIKNRYLDLAF